MLIAKCFIAFFWCENQGCRAMQLLLSLAEGSGYKVLASELLLAFTKLYLLR